MREPSTATTYSISQANIPARPNIFAALLLTIRARANDPRSITSTLFTKTRLVTAKLIELPTGALADETARADSTSTIVPSGIRTGGEGSCLMSSGRMAGGPFGAAFIATNTVSGTPRRFKSRKTGGNTSKLHDDVRI